MSIDAKIAAVSVIAPQRCETCSGSGKDPDSRWDDCQACHGATKDRPVVRLLLEPRSRKSVAGQRVLTITNPPTLDPDQLSAMVGVEIWGNSSSVMIGTRKWAKRLGYTKLELIDPILKS